MTWRTDHTYVASPKITITKTVISQFFFAFLKVKFDKLKKTSAPKTDTDRIPLTELNLRLYVQLLLENKMVLQK